MKLWKRTCTGSWDRSSAALLSRYSFSSRFNRRSPTWIGIGQTRATILGNGPLARDTALAYPNLARRCNQLASLFLADKEAWQLGTEVAHHLLKGPLQ